jgi:3-oxoacyl-[acyl-carrier protein] reductase
MDLGISGRTALVMSSTEGLGFGCAAALVAEGVRVVINGRDAERGRDAAARLGGDTLFVAADVSRETERARLHAAARAHLGAISILVTNVGGPRGGSFASMQSDDWRAAFEQVMVSALDMARRCLPDMLEAGYGRIVNLSSTSAKETTPGYPLASGIKSGLVGALGVLAREVAPGGVTVNSILPGPFDTGGIRRAAARNPALAGLSPEEVQRRRGEHNPMKRVGSIEELGALCAFLCSRQAGYITGQAIVIDGGQVATLL